MNPAAYDTGKLQALMQLGIMPVKAENLPPELAPPTSEEKWRTRGSAVAGGLTGGLLANLGSSALASKFKLDPTMATRATQVGTGLGAAAGASIGNTLGTWSLDDKREDALRYHDLVRSRQPQKKEEAAELLFNYL